MNNRGHQVQVLLICLLFLVRLNTLNGMANSPVPPAGTDLFNGQSCLSVTFTPHVVYCGTTTISAQVNCNFTGTIQMQPIGQAQQISIPGGNLTVSNGVFVFDITVQENAPAILNIVTTVTSIWSDPGNCVLDQVCEPSTLVTSCTVPENNDCANALNIPVGETTCDYSIYSNHLWTSSGLSGNCSGNGDKDLFFRFEANFETTYVLFGVLPSNSMTFQLFESGCSGQQLYCISMGAYTQLTLSGLEPGESYIIRLSDLPDDNTGPVEMCVWSPYTCAMSILKNVQNEVCLDDCTGSATVEPVNGTAPFSYEWSDGQNTATAIDLCAGTYFVLITDYYGC